jgi:2-oxo-4-hydroxy-4-carboxy-5-ureidoimidazoline decarboxylase
MRSMTLLDQMPAAEFASEVAPLFEGAPRFLRRLADARPFGSADALFARAHRVALELPEEEQIELLDAHPRIGADPSTLSAHSRVEQGPAAEETAVHLAADLRRLNEAYERTFGFRFVVFVAGRPRAAILPLLEAALVADRDEELRRGLHDVVAIAADRALRS